MVIFQRSERCIRQVGKNLESMQIRNARRDGNGKKGTL